MLTPDLTARDIIHQLDSYPTIYQDDSVKRALSKFQFSLSNNSLKRRNLLVLDREDKEIGWITLCDVLAIIQPGKTNISQATDLEYINGWNISGFSNSSAYYIRHLVWWVSDDTWPSLEKQCAKIADMQVKNLVRPIKSCCIEASTSLKEVAAVMYEKNLFTLPVIDDKEKLIGFVRAEDIVLEAARIIMNLPEPSQNELAGQLKLNMAPTP
jgi:hypothetical protein